MSAPERVPGRSSTTVDACSAAHSGCQPRAAGKAMDGPVRNRRQPGSKWWAQDRSAQLPTRAHGQTAGRSRVISPPSAPAEVRNTALCALPAISVAPGCTTLSRADGPSSRYRRCPSTVSEPSRLTRPLAAERKTGASAAGVCRYVCRCVYGAVWRVITGAGAVTGVGSGSIPRQHSGSNSRISKKRMTFAATHNQRPLPTAGSCRSPEPAERLGGHARGLGTPRNTRSVADIAEPARWDLQRRFC